MVRIVTDRPNRMHALLTDVDQSPDITEHFGVTSSLPTSASSRPGTNAPPTTGAHGRAGRVRLVAAVGKAAS
jgi:hypothetical protein